MMGAGLLELFDPRDSKTITDRGHESIGAGLDDLGVSRSIELPREIEALLRSVGQVTFHPRIFEDHFTRRKDLLFASELIPVAEVDGWLWDRLRTEVWQSEAHPDADLAAWFDHLFPLLSIETTDRCLCLDLGFDGAEPPIVMLAPSVVGRPFGQTPRFVASSIRDFIGLPLADMDDDRDDARIGTPVEHGSNRYDQWMESRGHLFERS